MMSAARTSFGCCGVIAVEDDFSLETTGASRVWVVSVRVIRFALERFRGAARRRDILQLLATEVASRGESESVEVNSHACYISVSGYKSDFPTLETQLGSYSTNALNFASRCNEASHGLVAVVLA